MHRRWICFVAMAGVAFAGTACSSSHANRVAASDAPADRSASTPAGSPEKKPYAVIDSAAFSQDSDGARVVLNAKSPAPVHLV